jgi:hypothetical protein
MSILYLDHLRPIDEFVRTDDEDQPDLVLETESGLYFYGSWDPDSGYFSVWELLFEPETDEQKQFVDNMELPGRLYTNVTKFQYR